MNQTNNNNNTMQIPKTQRIACRICEQIFSTPQTLISHIESCHMNNNELSAATPTPTPTSLSSSPGKPLSLTLNLVSSAISGAKTPSSFSSAANLRSYANPFLYQNLYNYFPARNHIDLNYYRNYLYNYGRFQNGFSATPPSHFPAMRTMANNNNNFVFGQPPPLPQPRPQPQPQPQQMQFLAAGGVDSTTLPLLCQLEHRRPEIYVAVDENVSVPNFIDLTLRL